MSRTRIAAVVGLAAGLLVTDAALAFDTGSRYFSINGRLRQGTSLLYDTRSDDDFEQGFSQFIAEVKGTYRPNRNWTFIANFWLRGDWFPSQDRVSTPDGLIDYTDLAGRLNRRIPFNLNDHGVTTPNTLFPGSLAGTSTAGLSTGATANELRLFDDFDEVVRELSVKYRDSKGRFTVKAGKFQRGWGQSDGLRLLDILHPQDLRERFAFRDSDELRIPAWMVSADFNFRRLGIAGPFEKLGMHRPVLEVDFIPEVHHSLFVINQATPTDASSGGAFGLPHPFTAVPGQNGQIVGIPFFGADLRDRTPKETSFENAEWGLRLKFRALGGTATLNAFYGWQDLPVVVPTRSFGLPSGANRTATLFAGTRVPGLSVPGFPGGVALNMPTTFAFIHGPAAFRQFLEGLAPAPGGRPSVPFAAAAPILGGLPPAVIGAILGGAAAPPVNVYTPTLATALLGGIPTVADPRAVPLPGPISGALGLTGLPTPFICEDLLALGAPVADPLGLGRPTVPCSFNASFDLDYRHRQKVIGFSFTRDMSEFKFGPKRTSPVLRTEFSWEFDKPFNRSRVTNPAALLFPGSGGPGNVLGDKGGLLAGTNALLADPAELITESDVASLMIGIDYPLWLPFVKKQRKSIFTSFQFFEIYTLDAGEGLLQQAPYAFSTVPSMHEFVTFLWNWPVWNEKLVLEGLLIEDFDNSGTVYRQRIDYQGFGNKWRPRIEWMHFSGDAETAPAGVFADSDFLEFSLTYQF